MDEWDSIQSPEIHLHTYSQLIFDKGGRNIKWEKVFSVSGSGSLDSCM